MHKLFFVINIENLWVLETFWFSFSYILNFLGSVFYCCDKMPQSKNNVRKKEFISS